MKEIHVEKSSGNVFEDLGFSDPQEMIIKAELSRKISDIICHRHLTQKKAAELLRIDQPKISLLLRGKLTGFSIERLFRFLTLLGSNIHISIEPTLRSNEKGKIALS